MAVVVEMAAKVVMAVHLATAEATAETVVREKTVVQAVSAFQAEKLVVAKTIHQLEESLEAYILQLWQSGSYISPSSEDQYTLPWRWVICYGY
jgi:hypothetical protein